jgi:hypothetical protein
MLRFIAGSSNRLIGRDGSLIHQVIIKPNTEIDVTKLQLGLEVGHY